MTNQNRNLSIWFLVSGLALFGAIIPIWPYGYYALLRFFICGVCCYAVYNFSKQVMLKPHIFFLVAIAVLFNPLLPVHLSSRLLWLPIDAGVGIYFFIVSNKLKTVK